MKFFIRSVYISVFSFCFAFPPSCGQETSGEVEATQETYNVIEFAYKGILPQKSFSRYIDDYHSGFRFSFLKSFKSNPRLLAGLAFNYVRIEALSNTLEIADNFEIFDVRFTTSTSMWVISPQVRYYPEIGFWIIEPYIEASIGLNNIISRTVETVVGSEESSSDFHEYTAALSYSGGLGLQFNATEAFALHTSVSFFGGNNADYWIVDRILFEFPWDNFVKKSTQIDYLNFDIGLTFEF